MTFEIRWTESSFKKLQKLDRQIQERIVKKLDEAAATDPFVISKKLSGVNLYSIRVGDYRVIVSIERNVLVVMVVDLGHRSKIYKKL
jgi:mRNA interferase RelE/StbE